MSTPMRVTLKIATSLDARIALADGTSQWITGAQARARSHRLRAEHDGVLVGIGTALADDPLLTARTVPLPDRQPVRIVMDSSGRTPTSSRLIQSTAVGRVVVATAGLSAPWLAAEGAEVWNCGPPDGQVDPAELVDRCKAEGVDRLMVEGGGQVAAAFLRADLVTDLAWFRAPVLLGGDGRPAVGALELADLGAAPRWQLASTERIGDDTLEHYIRG